jgi:cell division septum initiation protein DivIVA
MLGINAVDVYSFLDMLASQLEDTERMFGESQEELKQLRAKLDEYEQVGDRVNEQVIEMFSRAQLVAEEMVEDAARDARDRVGQARNRELRVVEDAVDVAGQQVRSSALRAQAQMQAVMDSFAKEVEQLTNGSEPGRPAGSA